MELEREDFDFTLYGLSNENLCESVYIYDEKDENREIVVMIVLGMWFISVMLLWWKAADIWGPFSAFVMFPYVFISYEFISAVFYWMNKGALLDIGKYER